MAFQLKIALLYLFFGSVLSQLSSNSDRFALLNLRASLSIRARDWPKRAEPCFNWTGIQCQDGRVTGINLSGLRRTYRGQLNPRFAVDSLRNLTLLSSFNSSGFSLPGRIPEWFGRTLVTLQVLDLSSCSIFGSVPVSLGSLGELKSLNLSGNSITGAIPSALGELYSLSILDLSRNLITGSIPDAISALGNLTSLDLSSNSLEGAIPSQLGSLSRLRSLRLQGNSLSNSIPPQLGNLSQLVELDVGHNYLSGSLPENLGELKSLHKFLVTSNELQGALPAKLFLNLNHVTHMMLSHNHFDGQFPDVLMAMPQLRFLDASGNKFTGALPNITVFSKDPNILFNFSNNLFYGNLSSIVQNISVIDLSSNYFGGLAPTSSKNSPEFTNNCFLSIPDQRVFEECRTFYAKQGLVYYRNDDPEPHVPPISAPSRNKKKFTYIMMGTVGGIGLIVIFGSGVLLIRRLCAKHGVKKRGVIDVRPVSLEDSTPHTSTSPKSSGLGETFAYEQILHATSNFSESNLIKHGRSGDLFYGTLNGKLVVVKRVNLQFASKEMSNLELDLFCKVTHPRLVPLIGHCLDHENEMILVYKHMSNGDLSNSLYKATDLEADGLQSLDWITRLKIAIGAAEGLTYLHHECDPPLVHRDIQASSILLDDKYEVRLGSLSEVCSQGGDNNQCTIKRLLRMPQTSEKGSSGAGGPSPVTCAYDVYCFGKVLLELVTGKLGISSNLDEASTNEWLEKNLPCISIYEKEMIPKIVDESLLVDEDLLEEVWAVAVVAKSCLNPKPTRRPSMRHILTALENPFKVVRDEFSSARLRTTSSRRSWTAALFSSWRLSSSSESNNNNNNNTMIGQTREGIAINNSLKYSARGSHGSGAIEYSSSHKRSSSEIFPEPPDTHDTYTYTYGQDDN